MEVELALLLVSPVDGMVEVGSLPSGLEPEADSFCLCLLLFFVGLVELLGRPCWVELQGFVEFSLQACVSPELAGRLVLELLDVALDLFFSGATLTLSVGSVLGDD